MAICGRCGSETYGAKYCPECGLPQSLQNNDASSAEPGAFVPLEVGKKDRKARKAEKERKKRAAAIAAAAKTAQSAKASAAVSGASGAEDGSSKTGIVLVIVLCLISAFAIALALFLVVGYLDDESASSGSFVEQQVASSRSRSASSSAKSSSRSTFATQPEKDSLQAVITEAAALPEDDYTAESYGPLAEAIAAGRTTTSDEGALSQDVKSAIKRIESAISSLVPRVKPVTINGKDSSVVNIPAELTTSIVTANYAGTDSFLLSAVGQDGNVIDTLVDTVGPYVGTTANGKLQGTPNRFSVVTTGDWTITIAPVSDAPTIANGQRVIGDAVVLIDPQRAQQLTFSHLSEGNFIVYGQKGLSWNMIVNEIGPYTGAVPNAGYRMLAVRSDGDWSVSW